MVFTTCTPTVIGITNNGLVVSLVDVLSYTKPVADPATITLMLAMRPADDFTTVAAVRPAKFCAPWTLR